MPQRSVGLQSSQMCDEQISKFIKCQAEYGFVGKICGACSAYRVLLDQCLDKESLIRKKQNAQTARERMQRYHELVEKNANKI